MELLVSRSLHQRSNQRVLGLAVGLLLCFWVSRLIGIDHFPPFIDETIHIRLGEQGYQISPLINADLGRVFTGWWHMLFRTYAAGTIWIARIITVLAVLLGVSALISVGRLFAGRWGLVFAALLYIFSPYHFFFDRLALADPLSGAAVSLSLYFACRLKRRVNMLDAVISGVLLFIAFGAKVSSLPYYGIPLAAVLTLHPKPFSWRRQWLWLGVALITEVGLTLLFVIGLKVLGHDLLSNSFSLAASNRQQVTIDQMLSLSRISQNVLNTMNALGTYTGWLAFGLSLAGVGWLAIRRHFYLPLCLLAPSLAMWISIPQENRYWITSMALLLVCGAITLARIVENQPRVIHSASLGFVVAWGLLQWLPFSVTALQSPVNLPLASIDYDQYVKSDAGGFGLFEVRDYLTPFKVKQVIGMLSNCQGLRYLSQNRFPVICPHINPNGQDVQPLAELMTSSRMRGVYVVLENSPYVPAAAPGRLLTVIQRPGGKVSLSIYDLSP